MTIFSTDWVAAVRDPAEAAAQLVSRRLVHDELGPVYGPGLLPDWVKAAQAPPPTGVGEAAVKAVDAVDPPAIGKGIGGTATAVADSAKGVVGPFLDKGEGTVRPPLERMSERTGLKPYLPKSNINPSDPLGAVGTGLRPALIGSGIGAGLGLIGGLTGKKKRPLSGLLFGGLMGGAAGLGGGYLYDRLSGPSKDPTKPTPDQVTKATEQIRGLNPGLGGEIVEGAKQMPTMTSQQLGQVGSNVLTGGAVGAGVGAGAGAGIGLVARDKMNRMGVADRTETTGKFTGTAGPKGQVPKVPTPGSAVEVSKKVAPPKTTAWESARAGAYRGGKWGGGAGLLFSAGNQALQAGQKHLNETNPALVKDNLTRAFANAAAAAPSDDPAVTEARQQTLTEMQNELQTLTAQQAAGQKLDPMQRARIASLFERGDQLRMINLNPPAPTLDTPK